MYKERPVAYYTLSGPVVAAVPATIIAGRHDAGRLRVRDSVEGPNEVTEMSETPDGMPSSEPGFPEGNGKVADPASKACAAGRMRAHRRQQTSRDFSWLIVIGVILFITFVIAYFVYVNTKTRIPVKTVVVKAPRDLLPMKELVYTDQVKELGMTAWDQSSWELIYDFAAHAKDREKLKYMLKDWRGALWDEETARNKGRKHAPIKVNPESGLPLTPLFSQLSFQYDLKIEVELELTRKASLFLLFNYFFDGEMTGTAFRVHHDGRALFERYRRELRCNYPGGEAGQLVLEPGKKTTICIKVEDKPLHAGYRCFAAVGDHVIASGDFAPEWPEDRRYFHGDANRMLQADMPVPPQSGYVAFVTAPTCAAIVHRVTFRGTVAEYWREQRSDFRKTLRRFEEKAKEKAEEEGAELKEGEGRAAPPEQSVPEKAVKDEEE